MAKLYSYGSTQVKYRIESFNGGNTIFEILTWCFRIRIFIKLCPLGTRGFDYVHIRKYPQKNHKINQFSPNNFKSHTEPIPQKIRQTKVPQRGESRGQRTERHVICKAPEGDLRHSSGALIITCCSVLWT